MKTFKLLFAVALIGVIGCLGLLYAGIYPIGADVPHNSLTYWALQTMRERSVARASADLTPPSLDDPQMLLAGGADYNEMCAGCHLKPGKAQSEMSQGLYPPPPNLSLASDVYESRSKDLAQASAVRQFWIIKHGIKASAMAAWGRTHDDARIWAMVAFLQRLPSLTPDQYQILTARSDGESIDHDAMDMTSTPASDHEERDNGKTPEDSSSRPHSPLSTTTAALAEPTTVVENFQKALQTGATAAATALLDPQVKIFESGGVESSREEYISHHLGADIAFMKTATVTQKSRAGDAGENLAWVATESRIAAKADGKAVDAASTETMVLKKTQDGWRIVHIHWSSHPNQ